MIELRWYKYVRGHTPVLQYREEGEWKKIPMVFEKDEVRDFEELDDGA